MSFDLEYEVLIKDLKSAFVTCKQWEAFCRQDPSAQCEHSARLHLLEEGYRRQLEQLRQLVREQFARFDARRVSSLIGIPTQTLAPEELLMHRIWMGGPLPDAARQAVCQWESAIAEVQAPDDPEYELVLWVWDAAQLRGDPAFRAGRDVGGWAIGSYVVGREVLAVHALRKLALARAPQRLALFDALHAARCYVNLADYFRLLILYEAGGIYLDADTMPYRAATAFLAKPEVPDYVNFAFDPHTQQINATFVSWLNLVKDENGMLVARRGNGALRQILTAMDRNLGGMPHPPQGRDAGAAQDYAALLHQATYGEWHRHIGHTFLAYSDMTRRHAVLYDGQPEAVVGGLRGMRLRVDAITGADMPLSEDEERSYADCVAALERRGWRLERAQELEQVAELAWFREVPRMAYAPQLRAQPESCNYYSFLSQDHLLDRVNTLFAAYLLARNADRILDGDYWCPTRGSGQREQVVLRLARHGAADARRGAQ
ncbi:hypothetical protein ASC94_05575 [Massilia sp. Root418]|uniref:glycosyltransferase n=1 Tax=Massilia sp. Root418 TaxID=1736532 RepID=UPI0006F40A15|nr:glycosyltransferase [Massilia sp. Root418]KQX02035.1 hypothetical protein ASC94_05575 [Massilia sp. Root418]